MFYPIRRLPLLTLLVLLSACAARQQPQVDRRAVLLSDQPAPANQQCAVSGMPETLPPPDAVVDTGGLAADLAELWRTQELSPGYAVLSLAFDPTGVNVQREIIEHTLPPAVADSVQKLVFAHRRQVEPAEEEWGVRLRLDVNGGVDYEVGRQEVCPPRLRGQGVDSPVGEGALWHRITPGFRTRLVWVRVRVDPSGLVSGAAMERGGIGGTYDQPLLDYIRSLSFDPATRDGIPVTGETSVPVRVRAR